MGVGGFWPESRILSKLGPNLITLVTNHHAKLLTLLPYPSYANENRIRPCTGSNAMRVSYITVAKDYNIYIVAVTFVTNGESKFEHMQPQTKE